MDWSSQKRLRFSDFVFDRFPNSRCRANVTLENPDGEKFIESVESVGAEAAELRCSAQAAVDALGRAVGEACQFELLGVKAIKAFDTTVIIVAISARREGEVYRLVGSYLAEQNPERGAALAVLNATNRFLGNLIFAR